MKSKDILFWTLVVIFATCAAGLTLRATSRYGLGMSNDSTAYLRLARDIYENGFAFLWERKAVPQPPAFPVLVAGLSRMTQTSLPAAARLLNVVAAVSLAVLIMLSVRRVTSSLTVMIVIGTLVVFSVPLTFVQTMAWTEPLFITIITALFLLITGPRPSCRNTFLAGLLTAIACLTRYVGILLIPLVAAYLLVVHAGTLRSRLKHVLVYALTPCLVLTLYLARNHVVSGTFLGTHAASQTGLKQNLDFATYTLLPWFLSPRVRSCDTLLLALCLGLGAVLWSRRGRVAAVTRDARRVVVLNGAFVVCYTAFIVWTSSTTAYDRIGDRLLAPMYPALLVVLAAYLQPEIWDRRLHARVALAVFCAGCVISPVRSVLSAVKVKALEGAGGYSSRAWQKSEMLVWLKQTGQPKGEVLFSNVPCALESVAEISAGLSPAKRYYNSRTTTGIGADNLFDRVPGWEGALLIWFRRSRSDNLFTLVDLATMCNLVMVREFPDGVIYRIERPDKHHEG